MITNHNINYSAFKTKTTNKQILALFCFFISYVCFCQNLDFFTKRNKEKNDSIIKSLREKNNLTYLSFIPNVSYSQIQGINFGISVTNFIRIIQYNRRNKIEIEKIKDTLSERLSNATEKAEEKYLEIYTNIVAIQSEIKLFKLKENSFIIIKNKADNLEIKHTSYLDALHGYCMAVNGLKNKIMKQLIKAQFFESKYGDNTLYIEIEKTLKSLKKYEQYCISSN